MVIHSINIGIFVLFGIFLEFLNFRDIIRRYLRIEPVVLNVGKIAEPGNCTKLKFRQALVQVHSSLHFTVSN